MAPDHDHGDVPTRCVAVRRVRSLVPTIGLAATATALTVLAAAGLIYHWPLGLPLVAAARLLRWIVTSVYVAAPVCALGAVLASGAVPSDGSPRPGWRFAVAWALGWTAVVLGGTVALAIGCYHDLIWTAAAALGNAALLVALLVLRWRPLLELRSRARRQWQRWQARGVRSCWDLVILACLAGALLLASLPPDARDELVYHLALPQFWRFQHDWWVPLDNAHWLFPANAEVIWGYGMAAGGIHVPRLLTLSFGLATLVLLAGWLKEIGVDYWTGRVSLAFLLAAPMVLVLLGTCSVEWPMVFFLILGWRSSRYYLATGAGRDAALTALAWGICLGFKYAVFPVVAGLMVEWSVAIARRWGLRRALAAIGMLVVAATVLTGGWLARNWRLTGDPIYPLGGAWVHATGEAAPEASVLLNYSGFAGAWRFVPWLYHATAESVLDQRLHAGWPLLLIAVAIAGWRLAGRLPWFTVVGVSLLYLRFSPAPRAYVPVMMLAWLFLPEFLQSLSPRSRARLGASAITLALVLTSLPWFYVILTRTAPSGPSDEQGRTSDIAVARHDGVQNFLLGNISDEELLRQDDVITPVVQWLRTQTPKDARVWVWGGERTFYLDRWARASSFLDKPLMLAWFEKYGAEALTRKLIEERLDLILVDTTSCALPPISIRTEARVWPVAPALQPVIAGWMRANLRELARDHIYTLFLILPTQPHKRSVSHAIIPPVQAQQRRTR